VFYITSMWVAGIMQGLMWRAYDAFGFLQYSFAESVMAVHPYYVIRMLGGLMFLIGALLMVYNLIQTVRSRSTEPVFALPGALAVAGE
jgi:cytochrome c oxidase cbb3-type subunit 1